MNKMILNLSGLILIITIVVSCGTPGTDHEKQDKKPGEVSSTSFSFNVNETTLKLNYFSSGDLSTLDEKIVNLVVVVHGASRNPFTYFSNMYKAAELADAEERTLIIAPGFIMEKDLEGNEDLLSDNHIFWTDDGWKQGEKSLTNSESNPRIESLSSFEVMDSIIWQTITSGNFPNIKSVVIAGNSAGGQFVNRYLGSNLIHEKVREEFGIEIKYMVCAPSSYTYLTAERPVIESPGEFYIPVDTCCNGMYNHYKYGLEGINEYLERSGAEKIREQYGKREVAYFVGAQDNDPEGRSLDRRCGAMLEGRQRRERAELFNEYLYHLYGRRWSLTIVPDAAHNHAKMFASEEGRDWLFN